MLPLQDVVRQPRQTPFLRLCLYDAILVINPVNTSTGFLEGVTGMQQPYVLALQSKQPIFTALHPSPKELEGRVITV